MTIIFMVLYFFIYCDFVSAEATVGPTVAATPTIAACFFHPVRRFRSKIS